MLRASYKYSYTHGQGNTLASHTSTSTVLRGLYFRFLRLTASQPLYPDFLAPRVLRLGVQNDLAARMIQHSLRRILLSIRTLHGPRYTPQQFVGLFDAANADRQISRLFASEYGPLRTLRREVQGCTASIKDNYPTSAGTFSSCQSFDTHYAVVDFKQLSGKQNETVVNELYIAARNVLDTCHF